MSEPWNGPEIHGTPTQEQLDAQEAEAITQGWQFDHSLPMSVIFRCDYWWDEKYRCASQIEITTSTSEYTVAAYQEARVGMVAAGWTWGANFDYCPEHSK